MRNLKMLIMLVLITLMWADIGRSEVQFKTDRIEQEFEQLYSKNLELYQIVIFANYKLAEISKKNLVITEIYRTQAEQDKYYKGKKKFKSPHQRWLAVDIRTRHLSKKEVKLLVEAINKRYNSINRYNPSAFYHSIGRGHHIHIQFKDRN